MTKQFIANCRKGPLHPSNSISSFAGNTTRLKRGVLTAISALLFGLGHVYQGWVASGLLVFDGLLFGLLTHWRGTVRPAMIAHAWQDSFTGIVGSALLRRLN